MIRLPGRDDDVFKAQMRKEPLRTVSGWIVPLGIVYVIAGLIALCSVIFATKVTVFVVGIMVLISGIAEVINAFQLRSGANSCSGEPSAFCTSLPVSSRS